MKPPAVGPGLAPVTIPDGQETLTGEAPSGGVSQDPPVRPISLGDSPARPPPRSLVPTLRVVAGRDVLRFVPLAVGTEILVGRDDGVGLQLSDPTVSRRHARVLVAEDGAVGVEDLGSTNGLRVNGVAARHARLRPGDTVEIGSVPMRLDLLSPDELSHLGAVLARVGAPASDPLTGLLPESWLAEGLPEEVDAVRRAGGELCALAVSVGNLPAIRAAWGPALVADVVRVVARLVVLSVRDSDPCCRIGADGILVVLHAPAPAGRHVGDRISGLLAQHDWRRLTRGLVVHARVSVVPLDPEEPVPAWIARAITVDPDA